MQHILLTLTLTLTPSVGTEMMYRTRVAHSMIVAGSVLVQPAAAGLGMSSTHRSIIDAPESVHSLPTQLDRVLTLVMARSTSTHPKYYTPE